MGATFGKASTHKPQELIPEGQYDAILFSVIELGTHTKESQFGVKTNPEIMFMFEIPELQMTYEKDGKEVTAPRVINSRFNQFMNDKAKLRMFLEAWRGKSLTEEDIATFTPDKVLGRGAQISIEHSKNGKYANIKSIAPLHKSVKLGAPQNPIVNFGIADLNNPAEFDKLYPWVQKIVMESHEAQDAPVEPVIQTAEPAVEDDSDIPW